MATEPFIVNNKRKKTLVKLTDNVILISINRMPASNSFSATTNKNLIPLVGLFLLFTKLHLMLDFYSHRFHRRITWLAFVSNAANTTSIDKFITHISLDIRLYCLKHSERVSFSYFGVFSFELTLCDGCCALFFMYPLLVSFAWIALINYTWATSMDIITIQSNIKCSIKISI